MTLGAAFCPWLPSHIELYGFLTCDANETVGAIHPKAMPLPLTAPDEMDTWLETPWEVAREL